MHGDGEFEINQLKEEIAPTEAVIYGENEHVPVVERSIRTVKERCRTTCRAAPYTRYTTLMVQHLVTSRVSWLNKFPSKNGVSQTMSPATIVLGHAKPNMKTKRIPFGSYAMCYTQTSNDMKTRAVPGVALSEANEKGGQYFMNLHTGKRIHAFAWKELPVPDWVIEKVEEMAEIEGQPKMTDRTPLFEWAPGVPVLDEDENINVDEDEDELHEEEGAHGEEEHNNDIDEENNDGNVITDDEDNNVDSADDDDDTGESQERQVNHEHDEERVENPLQQETFLVEDVTEEDEVEGVEETDTTEREERGHETNVTNDRP